MTARTAVVMVESPTNPLMRICDIRALAAEVDPVREWLAPRRLTVASSLKTIHA